MGPGRRRTAAGTRPPAVLWATRAGSSTDAIHTTLVAMAVLAADSLGVGDGVPAMVLSVVGSVLVFRLANLYSEVLAALVVTGLGERSALNRSTTEFGRHELLALSGALWMLIALVASRLAGADTDTAVDLALWCAVAQLVGWGAVAGLGSGLSGIRLVAAMAGSGLFGVLIVGLKLLAH